MLTKRILIIDDEADIQAVAQLALQTVAGWQVSLASSGSEGVDKAAIEQPDAILLDVMMPEMDGFATLQALQSQPTTQAIPVILMTAKTALPQAVESPSYAGMIPKPFKAMQLAQQISLALCWS
ncbi:MAG: response regulator [Synechococcales bacterium]|nr:response regulator [Synechococcales bacterium]